MKKARRMLVHHSKLLVLLFLVLAATISLSWGAQPGETIGVPGIQLPPTANGAPPSWAEKAFRQGVVAVANPYGAEAGAQILEAGGNAIDAAVAIAYALNVVEPQSAGIGGGGFMMIHIADTGETVIIDSREKAPAGATRDMFVGVSNASTQGIAVGVPGMVRGTAMALERYGSKSLGDVMAPAIKLAEDGFAATPRYVSASCSSRARNYPETEAYFCPGGTPRVNVGEIVTNPDLAETFKIIGSQGPDAFYIGDIAKGIIEGQKRYRTGGKPGTMTETDLEDYEPAIRVPVEASYRGYIIKSMPSPSSGGLTILQMLKMLERFTIGDASKGFGFGETNTLHVMIEAMRLAYADRAIWMGDADFAYVPAKGLLNPNYVALRGANIKLNSRITPNPTAGDPRPYDVAALSPSTMLAVADPVTGPGETTTHFSVVDKKGNFVSYTNTIESSHGIGVFAGYTDSSGQFKNFGFLLNNELTDFNTTPSINPYTGTFGTNDVEPGKRPRSSMAPSMIFDPKGNPIVAFGSPGGATIINSVFQVTMNLIDHGMSIQDAINAPRISVTAASGGTSMEPGFSQETIDDLLALGHSISVATTADIGSIQAVLVDLQTGKQYGGADSRREGTVIGLPRPQGKK